VPDLRRRPPSGFTLIELTVALLVAGVTMAGLSVAYASYRTSIGAKRSAQVFAQDLSVARSYAVRTRDTVNVVFTESTPGYVIYSPSGDTLVNREFTVDSDLHLDTLDLQVTGDSILFDSRGRMDFSGVTGTVGVVWFIIGQGRYQVRFNMLGTSRVSPL